MTHVSDAPRVLAARAMSRGADQDYEELADLVAYLVVAEPDVSRVLEIGVKHGGTLSLWRDLWPEATIVGVDLHAPTPLLPDIPLVDDATIVLGDSRHRQTYDEVLDLLGGVSIFAEVDLLHIDGGHDEDTFRSDWTTYTPLVRDSGLVLVHDVNWPSVRDAFRELAEPYEGAFSITRHSDRLGFGVVPWKAE